MKTTCTLINKSSGRVGYAINDPDCTVRRILFPGQLMKNIKVSELEKLIQQPGGLNLFYNYLQIDDEEILNHLLGREQVAPEYWLTEDKIPTWINSCSLSEFQDALDFAPEGTKDLLKKYAVSTPLKDYDKRQAMLEQLGFDVSAAIKLATQNEEKSEESPKATVAAPIGRRATTTTIVKSTTSKD